MTTTRPKAVRNDPHIKEAYEIHDEYVEHLRSWQRHQRRYPNKIFLWALMRNTLITAKAQDWESKPSLPGYDELRNAIDVADDWNGLFDATNFDLNSETPLQDLARIHDSGGENSGANDSEYMQYTRTLVAKRAAVERAAKRLREHVFAGVTREGIWKVYAGFDSTDGGSFMSEFMELDYSIQVSVLSKLTFGMGASANGREFLADCLKHEKGLSVLDFFNPQDSLPVSKKESDGSGVYATVRVANGPKDSTPFEHRRLSDLDIVVPHLTSFFGTGEQLLALAYQLLPGAALLDREDRTVTPFESGEAVGKLLLPFLDPDEAKKAGDDVYEDLMTNIPSGADALNDVNKSVGTMLKVGTFAGPLGFDDTHKAFGVFALFTSTCSIIVRVADASQDDLEAGLAVGKDILGLSAVEDAFDLVRGKTVTVTAQGAMDFEWAGFPHKISSLLEFIGPLADVIDVTLNVAGAIEDLASGDSLSGGVKAAAAVGGVLTLTSAIASVGTGTIALPWLFAVGVAVGITAAVVGTFLQTNMLTEWFEHTAFGPKYGQGTKDPTSIYYEFDRELESDPDRHFARQVSGYYWLAMPITGTTGDQGRLMKAHVSKGEPKEPDKYGSEETHVATLELPVIGGASEASRLVLKPLFRRQDAFTKIMDSYMGYGGPVAQEFLLGHDTVKDSQYSPNDGMMEVEAGLENVRLYVRWNWHHLSPAKGQIQSFMARLELEDGGSVEDLFGLGESDLKNPPANLTPYLTVQHAPPQLDSLVRSHLAGVGASLGDREKGDLYERMPVLPTRRIPITHDL